MTTTPDTNREAIAEYRRRALIETALAEIRKALEASHE